MKNSSVYRFIEIYIYILFDDIQIGNTCNISALDKCVGIERKLCRYASEKSLRMEL